MNTADYLVWLSIACNSAAVVCRVPGFSFLLYAAGALSAGGSAGVLWYAAGIPPVAYPRGVLLCLGAGLFVPYLLFVAGGRSRRAAVLFPLGSSAVLAASFLFPRGYPSSFPPVLRSSWFLPHVLSYLAAYVLLTAAFAVEAWKGAEGVPAHRDAGGTGGGDPARRLVRAGFPFLTWGLAAGMFWADVAWGTPWSWDPKETWAFITWLLYALYLLCVETPSLRKYARWYHAAAFAALAFTLVAVNLLRAMKHSLHAY